YVSLLGSALSDASLAASTDATPLLSLAGVSVSFDAPQAGLSLPGRLKAVSENRIDVQVPMELQGQSSVLVKVSIGDISSATYNLRLSELLARVRVPTLWGSLLSCGPIVNRPINEFGEPADLT